MQKNVIELSQTKVRVNLCSRSRDILYTIQYHIIYAITYEKTTHD
jgi:hypothetical protein